MLKLALTPKWIASLLLALTVAAAFGVLATWQWGRSHDAPPPSEAITEKVKPLEDVYQPGQPLFQAQADQMVTFTAQIDPSKTMVISQRLQSGDKGYWQVVGARVEGKEAYIPVVRGWSKTPEDPKPMEAGTVKITGRLLPPEAPEPEATEGQVRPWLSPASLTNEWDVPVYDAFVVSSSVLPEKSPKELERVIVGPQPQGSSINWLNLFYAIEWIVFAGFAFFIWFRLLRNDYLNQQEDARWKARAEGAGGPEPENTPEIKRPEEGQE